MYYYRTQTDNVANKAIEMILHNGLRKYKVKNSNENIHILEEAKKLDSKNGNTKNKKGSIFITRSKEHLSTSIGTVGVVLTSQEAAFEHIGKVSHWTPNVFNYGTYVNNNKTVVKGHEERNLQQVNCFVVDIDTKKNTPGEIVLAAMDKQLNMPTLILETDKGYHVYFVLDEPMYVTNRKNYLGLTIAKRISENIRKALAEDLTGEDRTCNHFGFFRMPNDENIVWFNEDCTSNLAELMDWSKDQDIAHRRNLFTVFTNNSVTINQISQDWVQDFINCTNIKGSKGVLGRDNTAFTLALACYSSGKTEEETFDLLDQFNTNLNIPLKNNEIKKVIRSAFSGRYKGANKEHIQSILETWSDGNVSVPYFNAPNNWYKHKKERKDRVRSHWYEWEQDIINYLHNHQDTKKGFIYITQRSICEELNMAKSTLNTVLKKSNRIYMHVVGKGNQKETGLSTLAMLFNYAIHKKATHRNAFISLIQSINPKAGSVVLKLINKAKNEQNKGYLTQLLLGNTS